MKTSKKPALTGFQEWMEEGGYSDSTILIYARHVRRILADLGDLSAAFDPKALRSTVSSRPRSSRQVMKSAWNLYSDFVRVRGGPALPPLLGSRTGSPVDRRSGLRSRIVSDLPERVEVCVGALLLAGGRKWRRHVNKVSITRLTWNEASRTAEGGYFQVGTDLTFPAWPAVYWILRAWVQGPRPEIPDEAALVPAKHGGNWPAAIATIERAVRHAKGQPALGLIMAGKQPWHDLHDPLAHAGPDEAPPSSTGAGVE